MFLTALLLVQAVPQQQCPAMDANLPAVLAGWTRPGKQLQPGQSVRLYTSIPTPISSKIDDTPFVEGHTDGYAQVFFDVRVAGTYGIALDLPGRIELHRGRGYEDGPLPSVRTSQGPDCSTIRQIAYFDLKRGRHLLFVSDLARPEVMVMLVAPE